MRNWTLAVALTGAVCLAASWAQEPAAENTLDPVSQEATKLEAELGKLRDTAPEAGDVMVKLVDLYHQHGRVFGLVRVGERYIARHADKAPHKDVMLKFIDGLAASARNKELVATLRQFVSRYPEDANCDRLQLMLAQTLDRMGLREEAAEAYETHWRRQPAGPEHRHSGVAAFSLYAAGASGPAYLKAAEVGEAMYDALPAGNFALETGFQAFHYYRSASQWIKANLLAGKMLKKSPPADKNRLRYLWELMAGNYQNVGQWANSAQAWAQTRAIKDQESYHRAQIVAMYHGAVKGAEMEPVVNDYLQKYPQQVDRFTVRSYLPLAFLRDGDKARAVALLAEMLPLEATANSLATHYMQNTPNEPAANAQAEQVLLAALAKNPKDARALKYSLGIELYRDRLKDLPKARQQAREIVQQFPGDDGQTREALKWLLYTEASDDELRADVQKHLANRRQRYEWATHRGLLLEWINEAKANKDHAPRAAIAQALLTEANKDPFFPVWNAAQGGAEAPAQNAREALLANHQLTDDQLSHVCGQLGYYYRHYGDAAYRAKGATAFSVAAKRLPKRYDFAQAWLEVATDYSPKEVGKEATLHMLTFDPPNASTDIWRRMMQAANANEDAALVKQVYAWMQKAIAAHGFDSGYADTIGDVLAKFGMEAEALAHFQRSLDHDPNSHYSYTSATRLLAKIPEPAAKIDFLRKRFQIDADYHGTYASWLAQALFTAKDYAGLEAVLKETRARQNERPFRVWGLEDHTLTSVMNQIRALVEMPAADKQKTLAAIRDLKMGRSSGFSQLALLELIGEKDLKPMERLLAYADGVRQVWRDAHDWDNSFPYAQAAMTRKDYLSAATLLQSMMANISNIDEPRRKAGRDLLGVAYSRMGAVGLSIDERSPLAPLMQAALYLRLGDERMAFETYTANQALFNENRNDVPVDLLLFVCEHYMAAGGDENHEKVEDMLRSWLVAKGELPGIEERTKARVQLTLARNFFKAQRFDVARTEFTTVINRYAALPEAVEAEFGIGETFMAQKVYDQAELVFEKLASSRDRDVMVRAEFLRGVLANRKGDRDEARIIFRNVLERVPSVEVANQALFNLAEIYGAEQRYVDQLELLRTVGRLGRTSKRFHSPGVPLTIVVQDPDLAVSKGHSKIPVKVTTVPGGDEETVFLFSGGAGKGLFRADLETRLGSASKNDRILQVTGNDVIRVDYPEEFKKDFRSVTLTNTEIHIASGGEFKASSSKIVDEPEESFSKQLERQQIDAALENQDQRVSQGRPANQIKPGNPVYLQVKDGDRDRSNEPDDVVVKLDGASGDQVHVKLRETGPHTGIFEGMVKTGELPAGALASDTAIEHNPLMAIDKDLKTAWMSAPDGAAPKWLSVDLKDLKVVDRVTVMSPNPQQGAPVRGELQGSHDGQFWFRIASVPAMPEFVAPMFESGRMTTRVFAGDYTRLTAWSQIADLTKSGKPVEEAEAESLAWKADPEAQGAAQPKAVLWHGKLVQLRAGAARLLVTGVLTGVALDGRTELPLGPGGRSVDVWLEKGIHDLTVFAATTNGTSGVQCTLARANYNASVIQQQPFRAEDFELGHPGLKQVVAPEPAKVTSADGVWDFRFEPLDLRHARAVFHEYLGEAVVVNQMIVKGEEETYVPTDADVLALATNEVLEIAAGDSIIAGYTDEVTPNSESGSRLLTTKLQATYYNSQVNSIDYDLSRIQGGGVTQVRKEVLRIDPGDKFVVEIIDFDHDETAERDSIKFQVSVNDGAPIELTATETEAFTGIFTKEVETSASEERGKLTVKQGDRIYVAYVDAQNTYPGHSVPRETVVYVNQPSLGRVRIVETRLVPPPEGSKNLPEARFLPPPAATVAADAVKGVAFGVPFTVEVIDRDAAKHSRSTVTVRVTTTDGSKVDVRCALSQQFSTQNATPGQTAGATALEEGRFVGQILMQLGGGQTPDIVPRTSNMPTGLIGGPVLTEEETGGAAGAALVTRVLNVTGKDVITAVYNDELRPDGKAADAASRARLIANGSLASTDHDYEHPVELLHVGEKLFLRVIDPDLDVSDDRDQALVEITTNRGEKEMVGLSETAVHSGVFTGSFTLVSSDKPTANNYNPDNPSLECYFGDELTVKYVDKAASTESGTLELATTVPVVIGTDGLVAAFSKTFHDETLAVETQFHIAESYFELFKSHKKLARKEEQKADLEAGRRILKEVMEDYPNPKYAPRIAYLMGQFAQELGQWSDAITSYRTITRQYPDSTLAPDAQYKLAQCHEEAGDFDEALEAYVTLAATYPNSPLIPNVMIRICDRFYKLENYEVAAQVGEKFAERFESHQYAARMAFRVGQCNWKAKQYTAAAASFTKFMKKFPDDELASQSLFWAGESYRLAGDARKAWWFYNRTRNEFPGSDAAKYARGRLALPSMLAIFEQEATNIEQDDNN